ncbi:FAD binding domain-containing protein [Emericellopsis atlantica]|uniref:FAD binding domain-containing protein n=1 Tax=Emericellopsis atlantica TaxID=2614577 RepID=A0A9P7ZR48_9HYPO|nr:FAD binding domain-containing protein [Emericellopsis atlantica]KAG9256277.1 FAD binding domain-containing protein [Emericellopsis atlantica]
MKVIVVGAGIAGLTAALSLRRAGHSVHVFERSQLLHEIGAAIYVPPNATRFLTAFGLDPTALGFVQQKRASLVNRHTLESEVELANSETAMKVGGAKLWYAHRVDLHSGLKDLATGRGAGTRVEIHAGQPVVSYNPDTPSITLENGTEVTGDLVVCADGVRSEATQVVHGQPVAQCDPRPMNCAYRFLVPADVLEKDDKTSWFNESCDGWTRIFADVSADKRLVSYPCRNNTIHNFVLLVYEPRGDGAVEDWKAGVPVEEVLDKIASFSPRLKEVVNKTTEVKKWPLIYRNPIPRWSKGCMTLAGDAAHPMLPHQGQGGAQALEDGVALGIVMHGATDASDIEARLAIYENVRRNRASAIQTLSNVGQDQVRMISHQLAEYMAPEQIPKTPSDIFQYTYGFDVVRETLDAMRNYQPGFQLPHDFFESEVLGVPGRHIAQSWLGWCRGVLRNWIVPATRTAVA